MMPAAEKQRAFLAWFGDPEGVPPPSLVSMRFGSQQKAEYATAILATTEAGKGHAAMSRREKKRHIDALTAAASSVLAELLAAATQG